MRQTKPSQASLFDSPGAPVAAAQVLEMIRRGQHKQAVEAAKSLHRQQPTPESEKLLAEAYIARILSFDPQLVLEADSLHRLALERCPAARDRLEALRPRLDVRFGRLAQALGPLANEPAPAEAKAGAEDALRRELVVPAALAACAALPAAHPLRLAAAAIDLAFRAVTSGPVREDELAQPQVSRRSPLAPWKPLVRAIASFYGGDDAACAAHLALVDPDSAPARLVPRLHALLAGQPADQPDALVERVSGAAPTLRASLAQLDEALVRRQQAEVLRAIRPALYECRRSRPDLLATLRRRIFVRCAIAEIPPQRVRSALGDPLTHDAALYRLLALASERQQLRAPAAVAWSRFLTHSVREAAFAEDGPEASAVRLHVIGLIESEHPDELEHARAATTRAAGAEPPVPDDPHALDVAKLFSRVAGADPRPQVFERWLAWARSTGGDRAADGVLETWTRAQPGDPRPLLLLVESAERRGALKKALGLLARAEAVERLDPNLARTRFRLTVATALKHIQDQQLRPAAKDLEALQEMPEARTGQRPALLAGLRYLVDWHSGKERREPARAEVVRLLGDERVAFFLLDALAYRVRLPDADRTSLPPGSALDRLAALARACTLCAEVGVPVTLHIDRERKLLAGLQDGDAGALADEALLALSECALGSGRLELAHALSGAGLRHGVMTGRFLWLRARSLPDQAPRHRRECLRAATETARRARDSTLLAEIRAAAPRHHGAAAEIGLAPEDLERILARETSAKDYPSMDLPPPVGGEAGCCPVCGTVHDSDDNALDEEAFDDDWDDDDETDFDEDPFAPLPGASAGRGSASRLPPELSRLPPKVLTVIFEMIEKYGALVSGEELAQLDPGLHARFTRALDEHTLKAGALPGRGRHGRRSKRRRRR